MRLPPRDAAERRYEAENGNLVYLHSQADATFWDEQWERHDHSSGLYATAVPRNSLVARITRAHLPTGSLVLEGGCGLAQNSLHLHRIGYRTIALDFAKNTVVCVRRHIPEVRPLIGDVFHLPFESSCVNGYWSLGVIEHFLDGFHGILDEAYRVLKPDGYLFLTFPYMNPLRRLKARLGLYETIDRESIEESRFYQFALDKERVLEQVTSRFRLAYQVPFLPVGGLESESGSLGRAVLSFTRGASKISRASRTLLALALKPWTAHCLLLVLQK